MDPVAALVAHPVGVQTVAPAREPERRAEPAAATQVPAGLRDFTLKFEVDRDSGEVVVTIVDPETGDLLRQIPTEDALKLAKALESMGKTFLQDRA
jgi:flagellar protein FlaG